MDGHGEFSPLDRSRLLGSNLEGGSGGNAGNNNSGSSGSHPPSVGELAARAATPTTLATLAAQYHSRYGLPSAMPGPNYALMSSLLGASPTPEARKAILPELQHYWSAHPDNFPRYLMTGGLYPSYPPLIPGAAESLSLLGAGVACVAGGGTGAGPSQPHHVAHYQRLLEMQKEAYLASMSAAAANHHPALYAISPFLEQPPVSAHGATPLSLVKQEPKELSCTEKTAKLGEKRAMGFKVDLDNNRGGKDLSSSSSSGSSSSSLGSLQHGSLKEPKLSPSSSLGPPGKYDKKNGNSNLSQGSGAGKRTQSYSVTASGSIVPRHQQDSLRSKCTSPSNRPPSSASVLMSPRGISSGSSNNGSSSKKNGPKPSSGGNPKPKTSTTSTSGQLVQQCDNSNIAASSPSPSESPIVSVPTQAAAPIPLATVQHDGVVLSALASPSSAAASSAGVKPATIKQQADKLTRTAAVAGNKDPADSGKPQSEAGGSANGVSDRQIDTTHSYGQPRDNDGDVARNSFSGHTTKNSSSNNNNSSAPGDAVVVVVEDSKAGSDDNSDIVVDSTESDDVSSADKSKAEMDRAISETIDRVAAAADSDSETGQDNVTSQTSASSSPESATTSSVSVSITRTDTICTVTSSGSSAGLRTVCAKTQPVPSVAVSGCVQMSSTITTQANTSALPYYHTLYSKPQGVRKVHATTYVPEVGIFKGPCIKAMAKSASSPLSSAASATSPENRGRFESRSSNTLSSVTDGRLKARESTPSPSLLSPARDSNSSVSPGLAHTTVEISSSLETGSLDSASVRSHSVASFHSALEVDDSDDGSDGENSLIIDDEAEKEASSNAGSFDKQHDNTFDNKKKAVTDGDNDNNAKKVYVEGVSHRILAVTSAIDGARGKDDNCDDGDEEDDVIASTSSLPQRRTESVYKSDSQAKLVPSAVDESKCCDVAIDYSLPKTFAGTSSLSPLSSRDVLIRGSNSSQFHSTASHKLRDDLETTGLHNTANQIHFVGKEKEQTPPKKNTDLLKSFPRDKSNSHSTSSSKLVSSPTKPMIRKDVSRSSVKKFVVTPASPHKKVDVSSGQMKMEFTTPTSQAMRNKVTRRLCLHQDTDLRCASAPPVASDALKSTKTQSVAFTEIVEDLRGESQENSNDHSLGNIPVGIAVAQIRPHHIQQPRDLQAPGSHGRDIRHAHTSSATKTITQTTPSMAAPTTALPSSLVVTGRSVNPSPWLPQIPFSLHQAPMNSSGAPFDPSHYPITAPSGFKFAQDPITGQIFLVPTDFVEQGTVWPSPNFAPPAGTGHSHFPASHNLPTITVNGPEDRDGRAKAEVRNDKADSASAQENNPDKIIPALDPITKDRSGMTRDTGKHHAFAQPILGGSKSKSSVGSATSATASTILVNPVTCITTSTANPTGVKAGRPKVQSRGCSPILFEDDSSSLSILSTLSSLTSKRPTMCSIGVQTCDSLMKAGRKRKASPPKPVSHDQGSQTPSPNLNPLSVQCPELDAVDSLSHSLEVKVDPERPSYNPFTDPQILQAADGLELLSTLAEKRPKCSSIDDPKRIFPSPSDSFKSDSASIAAFEDTLSPGDTDLKSGQCTPRREVRRELSPKWTLPKKEPPAVSTFGDFKTPPEIEIMDASEVRARLAEVQRQYKEKQKELAKLQSKKTEEGKPSKRGPGRPPKKKVQTKKSDDDSSSSSSKTKDNHLPHKKKRPAEELVDRVFRKLPPLKSNKGSRSIHYVKSKTGPFFKRKSASSSLKRNKDLFGIDETNWPSYSERKHQEKLKSGGSVSGKSKSRQRSGSSQSEDSKHSHDAGNIFSNLESYSGDHVERRGRPPKHRPPKTSKHLSTQQGSVTVKAEPSSSTSSHQESGLGLLAKFALTTSPTSLSASSTSLSHPPLAPLSASTSQAGSSHTAVTASTTSNTTGGFMSSTFCTSNSIYGSSLYNCCLYNSSGNTPSITFGSMSSLMSSPNSSLMSFTSSNLSTSAPSTTTTANTTAVATSATVSTATSPSACTATTVTTTTMAAAFASTALTTPTTGTSSANPMVTSSEASSSGSTPSGDSHNVKRKHDEDSDTDTTDASDTSPNKKRKPGRPRKINPDDSSGGTETIWAKKSNSKGLMQSSDSSPCHGKDGDKKMDNSDDRPLFMGGEWTRRRSERIFLNEPNPQPPPPVLLVSPPVPQHSWLLANFMPKKNKVVTKDTSAEQSSSNSSANTSPTKSVPSSTLSSNPSAPSIMKLENKEATTSNTTVKTTEISIPKLEDAKKIVKMEDTFSASSFSTPSQPSTSSSSSTSPEKSKKKFKEREKEKNKGKKKLKKKKEGSSSSPPSSPPPPTLERREKRAEEHSKIKLQKARSLHDLTQRVKKKFSKTAAKKDMDDQKKSRRGKKKRKVSTDSSDNDNLPLSSYRDGPPTPEPRSCKLQTTDLREGLKVLYLNDGLFYEGTVKALQPPDVYGVLTAGQRGSRPHILCQEEVLKEAVLDVKPGSIRYLPEGTRVCAFWSQKFSCLYPGTVAKASPSHHAQTSVNVDFDDGDTGKIHIEHIRLLPSDFPIVEYEPDPLETLPKRRRRTMSDASDVRKSVDKEVRSSRSIKTEDDDDDDEEKDDDDDEDNKEDGSEDSDSTSSDGKPEGWRWEGKSTKRPGLKGKAKKTFYKAIIRGKEIIRVGDSAVFVSRDRANCPYIGRIESLWEGWNGQMMVKVCWYYHPEETQSNKKLADPKNALFESQHEDENDVQTISHRCEVLSVSQFKKQVGKLAKKGKSVKANVFYVAGFYDPAARHISFHPGVS